MRALAAAILLLLAVPAAGQSLVFRGEHANSGKSMSLRLYFEPCESAAVLKFLLRRVAASVAGEFQRAVLHWEGRPWESCWIEIAGIVYSIDEEGAALQPVRRSLFVDEST